MKSKLFIRSIGFILLTLILPFCTNGQELESFKKANSDLIEFLKLLSTNPYLASVTKWKSGTLIAPTNQAITDYKRIYNLQFTNNTLLYHYANVPKTQNEIASEDSINSELPANPPIWITKKNDGLYLNNAKIIRGNLKVKLAPGAQEQIVHVIDRVLEITAPTDSDQQQLYCPTARKFLENSAKYGLPSSLSTSKFASQVSKTIKNEKTSLLDTIGKRTYFIPVDEGFKTNNNIRSVDSRTIDGHIIPDRAIFLRTADIGQRVETYKTTDLAANFPIFISFAKETIDQKEIWLVKSDNREGDKDHLKGVVQAQIVKANIPVKNGVVHLISKPLVIIDTNVYETLRLYANEQIGSMREFYKLIRTNQAIEIELKKILEGPRDNTGPNAVKITLFVPSNKAMEKTDLSSVYQTAENLTELIKLHILSEPVSVERIVEKNKSVGKPKKPYQVTSLNPDRKLFFNVIGTEGNRTLFVEGGGVNATITQPDFGATNGYIHIIDKVLGIPNLSLEDKLRTHPLLQKTYQLWMKERFDEELNSLTEPYTFFAPSETAWSDLGRKSGGAYHNILHGTNSATPSQLIHRHLMVKQEHTIEKLSEMSKNHFSIIVRDTTTNNNKTNLTDVQINYPLKTLNGYLKVTENKTMVQHKTGAKEEIFYYVEWRNMAAHVVRTNVQCTNGIIHIIDTVLIDDSEITIASTTNQLLGQPYLISTLISTFSLIVFI